MKCVRWGEWGSVSQTVGLLHEIKPKYEYVNIINGTKMPAGTASYLRSAFKDFIDFPDSQLLWRSCRKRWHLSHCAHNEKVVAICLSARLMNEFSLV